MLPAPRIASHLPPIQFAERKKAHPAMAEDNVSNLPIDVDLDLDAEERPNRKPPLSVRIKGRVIEFKDPSDAPWQELLYIEGPYDMLQIACTPEDRQFIIDQKDMPGWQFEVLMDKYDKHYQLADKVRRARREAQQ